MNDAKYIGLDVHQATISATVLDSTGKLVMESILETKAETILQFLCGLRGSLHVTLEEGACAGWLHDLLKPHVTQMLVCDPRKNALLKVGNKNDRIDSRKLAELLGSNFSGPFSLRRHGPANAEGISAQLYDHHQRSHPRDGSSESALPKQGHPLCRSASVRAAHRAAWLEKNHRSMRAPPGRDVLPATRRAAAFAPASAARAAGREQKVRGHEAVASDPLDWSNSCSSLARAPTNTAPVSHQAATLGL